MKAAIAAIDYYLPEKTLTNEDLQAEFSDWSVDKIQAKTGIAARHIAAADEFSSDLAVAAAERLFAGGSCRPADIDFILLCTQSPDYLLPTTACLLQDRLNIPSTAGALDFNLGCSGFVYGLGLAKGLIETGQAKNLLLLTAETYSKFIQPDNRSVRTLFGDAAAATLVHAVDGEEDAAIGPFDYGTDGAGAAHLICREGAMRHRQEDGSAAEGLTMNGPEVFAFTLKRVPTSVARLLERANKNVDDIDLFIFHQANRFMLEHLRTKMGIAPERCYYFMENCGNTVSSTIPIALSEAIQDGTARSGDLVALVGFGVGYSWGSVLVRCP